MDVEGQPAGSDLKLLQALKDASTAQVYDWIPRSWSAVKKEVVVKSFTKRGVSNAMDGTEDDEFTGMRTVSLQKTPVMQKWQEMILLTLTVTESSWPSVVHKYCKLVTST